MTHNMKAFLELTGENKELAARVQLLMLGDNGRCQRSDSGRDNTPRRRTRP